MTALNHLPPELTKALKRETQGEIIRWVGRPKPSTTFLKAMPIWIMGIPWSAVTFTIFGAMLLAALSDKPPGHSVDPWELTMMRAGLLFTGVFALIGAGMLGYPFWAAWKARQTVYAITSERLLSLVVGKTVTTRSTWPNMIGQIERKEARDGSGSLSIVTGHKKDSEGDTVIQTEELIGVDNVAAAERQLLEFAPQCST